MSLPATYTKEELDEYRQVFALFDTDGSGAIGNDELGEAMRSMGMAPTDKELENLIREVDVDGNGEIDFDEFCMVMKRMTVKKETDEEIIKQCFVVFDQDSNGVISEAEFKHVLMELGGFPEEEIDEIFREVDVAGNGQIDYEEFAQMVRTYLLDEDVSASASSTSSSSTSTTNGGVGGSSSVVGGGVSASGNGLQQHSTSTRSSVKWNDRDDRRAI